MHIWEKLKKQYSDWGRVCFEPPAGLKIITPSNAHVDFPFPVVPAHIVSCGPIVRVSRPLKETDGELAKWLARRPTVYVNLGTHVSYDGETFAELAGAIQLLLDAAEKRGRELQVLWKQNGIQNIMGEEGLDEKKGANVFSKMGQDRVRTVDWLQAEPISILESGTVICSVNHGGANSYFEAVR